MTHRKIDINAPEYLEFSAAKEEYGKAAKFLNKMRMKFPVEHLRSQEQNAYWAIFIQKYRVISKRYFNARRALTASLSDPPPATNLDLLAASVDLDAPLPSLPSKFEGNPVLEKIAKVALLTSEQREELLKNSGLNAQIIAELNQLGELTDEIQLGDNPND